MSGICGILRFDGQRVRKEEIQNMLGSMQNRGDDTEKIWVDSNVGFGHKMLWTTPESLHENQPLISKDGNLVLIADARIDNRDELLEKLEVAENDFDVITDIDLILWSYQQWGDECSKFLIGDFAFAVWDKSKKILYCSRDHMGIKPFYYHMDYNQLIFSSEISSLFSYPNIKKEVNIEAIESSLLFDSIPYEQTYFKNILRLKRASYMLFDVSGKYDTKEYWDPADFKLNSHISFEDASLQLKSVYKTALESRLRSNYPISFELSGGLDSSSVISLSERIGIPRPFNLFSLRFGSLSCDEGKYIEAVSKQINKKVESIRTDLLDYEKQYSLESFYLENCDWPQDLFFIPHIVLSKKATFKKCRVMLTGQGGDDVLQGSRYMFTDFMRQMNIILLFKQLKVSKQKLDDLLNFVVKPLIPISIKKILRPFRYRSERKNSKKYINYFQQISYKNNKIKTLSSQDIIKGLYGTEYSLWCDTNTYNLYGKDNIEVRHPFFDRRLIEFCLTMPPEYLYTHSTKKYLFRNAMKGILPEIIRNRRDKASFDEIIKLQLDAEIKNNSALKDIQKLYIKKIIDVEIWTMIEKYHAKRSFRNDKLVLHWKLINLEYWYVNNFMA